MRVDGYINITSLCKAFFPDPERDLKTFKKVSQDL
jgi:hypothetical protein